MSKISDGEKKDNIIRFHVKNNTLLEGRDLLGSAINNGVEIDGKDPVVWALDNNRLFKGQNPIAFAIGKGKKIEDKDPVIWALNNMSRMPDDDPVLVAIAKRKKIEGKDPFKWMIDNDYTILGKNAIEMAIAMKRKIESKDPVIWAKDNNKKIMGFDPILAATVLHQKIDSQDPIEWAVQNNRKIYAFDPVILADKLNLEVNGSDPIEWAVQNNKKVNGFNAIDVAVYLEKKIDGIDSDEWAQKKGVECNRISYEAWTQAMFGDTSTVEFSSTLANLKEDMERLSALTKAREDENASVNFNFLASNNERPNSFSQLEGIDNSPQPTISSGSRNETTRTSEVSIKNKNQIDYKSEETLTQAINANINPQTKLLNNQTFEKALENAGVRIVPSEKIVEENKTTYTAKDNTNRKIILTEKRMDFGEYANIGLMNIDIAGGPAVGKLALQDIDGKPLPGLTMGFAFDKNGKALSMTPRGENVKFDGQVGYIELEDGKKAFLRVNKDKYEQYLSEITANSKEREEALAATPVIAEHTPRPASLESETNAHSNNDLSIIRGVEPEVSIPRVHEGAATHESAGNISPTLVEISGMSSPQPSATIVTERNERERRGSIAGFVPDEAAAVSPAQARLSAESQPVAITPPTLTTVINADPAVTVVPNPLINIRQNKLDLDSHDGAATPTSSLHTETGSHATTTSPMVEHMRSKTPPYSETSTSPRPTTISRVRRKSPSINP